MATCKDCLHFETCKNIYEVHGDGLSEESYVCDQFSNRSQFVKLPDIGDYDTVTTIDEAIDHCYKIATSTDENVCAECKAEHMRLCGWLGDLKRRIIAEQELKERESK